MDTATTSGFARNDVTKWSVRGRELEARHDRPPVLSLFCVLCFLWFAMSGHTETWLLAAGAACSALTVWLSLRLGILDREGHPVHLLGPGISYAGWLLVEIIKANLNVARIILFRPDEVDPAFVKVRPSQKSDLGRVIHANSITLTPGTITADIDENGLFTVHSLDAGSRQGLDDATIDRRVMRMVGGE